MTLVAKHRHVSKARQTSGQDSGYELRRKGVKRRPREDTNECQSCGSCRGLPEATLFPLSAPRTFAAASHARVIATAAAVARHVAVQSAGAQVVRDARRAVVVEREPRERALKAARSPSAARSRTRERRGGRLRSGGKSAGLTTVLETLQGAQQHNTHFTHARGSPCCAAPGTSATRTTGHAQPGSLHTALYIGFTWKVPLNAAICS